MKRIKVLMKNHVWIAQMMILQILYKKTFINYKINNYNLYLWII